MNGGYEILEEPQGYYFITSGGFKYTIFLSRHFLVSDLGAGILELQVLLYVDGSLAKRVPFDSKVSVTMKNFVTAFFEQRKNGVLAFSPYENDNRHNKRVLVFSRWYEKFFLESGIIMAEVVHKDKRTFLVYKNENPYIETIEARLSML